MRRQEQMSRSLKWKFSKDNPMISLVIPHDFSNFMFSDDVKLFSVSG